ncbi:hypothetical protein OPV22_026014 [Ensete ventricosum]|uniref:GrpE protein homolog n=1 Tax=Ensete ventricosum TaxID=4639 RepID=A0AAV8PA93_ENSVE|nr:hypothetical protein OPV22_026014 [Ensete ventricosum]
MASILRAPALLIAPPEEVAAGAARGAPLEAARSPPFFSARRRISWSLRQKLSPLVYKPLRFPNLGNFAAYGDTTEAGETAKTLEKEDSEEKTSVEDEALDGDSIDTEETVASTVMLSLQLYKEALANNDRSKVAEIEAFLQSIEDEKNSISAKIAALAEESSAERVRVLRISADFDNFRKRTERERLSLMTNVQGEVIESLLPVLDNFERAKSQIKVETEGEEKINSSYQSIYKQFLEILTSLGVEAVETVGSSFDPLFHEAIMHEESAEFEEGIIIQEFRKGFKLGERLLRPSMVKVSAGPGPEKTTDHENVVIVEDVDSSESIKDELDTI